VPERIKEKSKLSAAIRIETSNILLSKQFKEKETKFESIGALGFF
jgi:hypothetical protein